MQAMPGLSPTVITPSEVRSTTEFRQTPPRMHVAGLLSARFPRA